MMAIDVSFHTNTQMDLLAPWYEHRFRTLGIYNRKTLLADFNHRAVSSRFHDINQCRGVTKNEYRYQYPHENQFPFCKNLVSIREHGIGKETKNNNNWHRAAAYHALFIGSKSQSFHAITSSTIKTNL